MLVRTDPDPHMTRRGDFVMRTFRRIGDIIAANLNEMIDHFEIRR